LGTIEQNTLGVRWTESADDFGIKVRLKTDNSAEASENHCNLSTQ